MDQVTTKICIDFPERGRHMCHKRHTMPRRGERLYPCPLYTPESIHERSPVVLREKLQFLFWGFLIMVIAYNGPQNPVF